ncbi:GM17816 [Drosophila sechellia]|uniref:GM17816 n=1 Tax=Drosophila sechellia TaxID=7238 RepID=B4IJI0_DROSE|nr:GM17816 [Drosophila sechellia]
MIQILAHRSNFSPLVVFMLLLIDHRLIVNSSVPVLQNPSDEYTKYVPIEELKLPEDQELVVRLPSNSLLKYTSYKDVSILHFDVPPDSRTAYFTFKAFEDPKSAFQRKCKPKDVTLHLKASSYPVISPENITFPKNFFTKDQRFKVYDLQFLSDEQQQRITIEGPHIGNWFAVAFVSWSDPNNDRIEQQGLAASCDTLLSAEMSVSRFRPIIINNGQEHEDNLTSHVLPELNGANITKDALNTSRPLRSIPPKQQKQKVASKSLAEGKSSRAAQFPNTTENHNSTPTANNEIIYRFYVPDDIGDATARIMFNQVCDECPPVAFHVRANGYPLGGTDHNHGHGTIIRPNQTTEISIPFGVQPNSWHYALLTFVNEADEPEMPSQANNSHTNHSLSYVLQIDYITEDSDNAMQQSKTVQNSTNSSSANPWEPTKFRQMNFYSLLRQTYREFFMYVTMGLFCHGSGTARVSIMESVKEFISKHQDMLADMRSPCDCAESVPRYTSCLKSPDCLEAMNETETLKVKECIMDDKCSTNFKQMTRLFVEHHKAAMEQHVAVENCNTSVVFSVSSSPCVAGRCGRFGRCYHYMSGGFVFSTCVCSKGYRGWDCTEDSQVPTNMSILLATLLLTLSNLLFFPSIYMAVKRRYYTEGVIYFFAMFFSIFYHACDAGEDEYSFCLVKIGVLQFCDFYCGLLSIWVTLVAMAHVRTELVSLLHMFGAILLAFGTELNKQSLWVFLAPALTGICLISTSWGLRCAKSRKLFPSRRYLSVWLPFGLTLVVAGLVCYAFLQTKQNYHIVHSIWHMVMALSILCLLPSRKSFVPKC